jgi:hypothetical protein
MKLTGLIPLLLVAMTGCYSVGPKTVPQDQFNYNNAIAESAQEQLLVNLVRLRYNETPVFLKVGSVISQYSRIASANAGVTTNASASGDNTASAGGSVTWADRPTITYLPISGQEFARNLLTPIPPGSIFNMIQSGWSAELLLPLTVWSINQIDNEVARPTNRRQAGPELVEMLEIWNRLRESSLLGIRKAPAEAGESRSILFLRDVPLSEQETSDFMRFAELLDVDHRSLEFSMIYGLVPEKPNDIAVLTGSVMEIMLSMAWQFEVPPGHIQSGRTGETFQSARNAGTAPIEVHFADKKPADAFVAVYRHDYWFYIDQRDRKSKQAFSFLQLLLNLVETGTADHAPVFTISN